jgi:protein involved in polysaccharide export with SLBB domain
MRKLRAIPQTALTGLLVLLAGCSFGPGGLTVLPSGHRLLPEARELRWQMPPAVPRELDKAPLPPYVVEPGDVLLIQPADFDSPLRLPGDQAVLPDGTVSLGRYGSLVAAGKTVEQIQAEVRALLEAQMREVGPIVVRVVVRASKVFYVLGEVNAPGAFPLTGRETVLDALLIAGGLNDRSSRRNIILSRPSHPGDCPTVLPVCYDRIVQLGDTATNYQLAPGDRLFVPTRSAWDDCCFRKKAACPPPPCPAPVGPASRRSAEVPAPRPPREDVPELVPVPRRLPGQE